jgi:uncharacterized protein (TIGR03435 family)
MQCECERAFLATVCVAALTVLFVAGVLTAPRLQAQSPASQSAATQGAQSAEAMEAAGVKMSFDVASVKLNVSASRSSQANPPAFFNLDTADVPTTGLLSLTNVGLRPMLAFAFKLNYLQQGKLLFGLPKQVDAERFDVQAKADGTPGTDQMRLMMQSLLADRFELAMHRETRQLPVYVLMVAKAGKTGSQLIPHLDASKCTDASSKPPARGLGDAPQQFPCGTVFVLDATPVRQRIWGGNLTMPMLAAFLGIWPSIDRPVVDHTNLGGNFDVFMDTVRQGPPRVAPSGADAGDSGLDEAPSIFTALQEQLGLKLEPETGAVDVVVIDHIEEPSPN